MADSLNRVMVRGKIANLVHLVLAITAVSALGFPLNVPASLSTALAVDVGADYSIYLLMRLREEPGKGMPWRPRSRPAVLRRVASLCSCRPASLGDIPNCCSRSTSTRTACSVD